MYGASCAAFLLGKGAWNKYKWLQAIMILAGAILNTATVWLLADIFNGLMAIPNLICVAALSPELIRLTREYTKKKSAERSS